MPRLQNALPRYRKHRATGQAIVHLSGQDFYLGPHGTKASKLEYDRLVAEWLVRGRRSITGRHGAADEITIVELIAAYKQHAEVYCRKDGVITNEVKMILAAAKVLLQLYGRQLIGAFDPLKLEAVRASMIRLGWCRKQINKQVGRLVRMFRWGAQKRFVGGDVVNALRELEGLKEGRSGARESAPVKPIDDSIVNATLEHLPPLVADMVRLQRLTGCRPEEICRLRPCDVDTSGDVWSYRPASHKTQHYDKDQVIFFGPKSQDVLRSHFTERQLKRTGAVIRRPKFRAPKRFIESIVVAARPLSSGSMVQA